jgi:type VI secretion system protein ImpA
LAQSINEKEILKMLQPIPGELPVLGDLRQDISTDSSYQILRSARTNARNNERAAQNEGNTTPININDWALIIDKVPTVLSKESKDIELVAWYIEALTRVYGFRGLGLGYSLARQLIDSYGEQLYPQPDEEGVISQLSSLVGLNGFGSEGALIYPIKAINITQGDVPGPLAVWQCEQVLEADRISDLEKREARFKQNGISRAQLDDILNETDTAFLQQIQSDIQYAIDEYMLFQEVLDRYSEEDPLPTAQILDALESSMKILSYVAGDRLQTHTTHDLSEGIDSAVQSDSEAQKGTKVIADFPIADREDALQRLREVASYFRRSEPHSPISYSIEQAIRWSNLPLTDLIKELIPDEPARTKYQHLSGIGAITADKN